MHRRYIEHVARVGWMRAALLCLCAAALGACASVGQCGLSECPADARISAEVRELLGRSPALGAPNLIEVRTRRGVVYLRGVVSTPYQIEQAGSLASAAPGVREVENLLTVDNSR
jgi:osmotically-inducible protein OsmY